MSFRFKIFLATVLSVAGLAVPGPASAQSPAAPVIFLNQAWSQSDRETYYQISQGSEVMPYAIFLNLEVANGTQLFRSDANSVRYGLIPQVPNPRTNPDGLPVGLTRTVFSSGRWKGPEIGMTCAACHTAQLTYQGHRIRIDGGVNNTFDFMAYVDALDDAMQETLSDRTKYGRLAAAIEAADPAGGHELRERFEAAAKRVHDYRTRTLVAPTPWGPSRIDALHLIGDRAIADLPDIPQNWVTPIAPTKMPFVWNSPQGSWTQWSGIAQVPLDRNYGETMGVFLSMDLTSGTPKEGLFDSSAAILNLGKIESMIQRLAPPQWPETVFGKIDAVKAAEGQILFVSKCAGCHNAWPYRWTAPNKYGKSFVDVGLVPQSYVGTDPSQFMGGREYSITAQLAPYMPPPYRNQTLVPSGLLLEAIERRALVTALDKLKLTDAEMLTLNGFREFPIPAEPHDAYKAAPRDGVWATPPFMHNGSVPNLYEMLLPAAQRSRVFHIGREFDPIRVGLDTSARPGAFLFDTSLPGNSNAGHSFQDGPPGNGVIGPLLTDRQRWALVEYLKSIPQQAGRVTPFGGPPNAIVGHGRWSQ